VKAANVCCGTQGVAEYALTFVTHVPFFELLAVAGSVVLVRR
jgi:hypothetical protein